MLTQERADKLNETKMYPPIRGENLKSLKFNLKLKKTGKKIRTLITKLSTLRQRKNYANDQTETPTVLYS